MTTDIKPEQFNILVVDDTPENLSLLSGMLRDRGFRIRPVPSGRLALQAAAHEAPDLVLLDINMPEMNGYEVCRRLKEDPGLREIPVIFVSALTETFDKVAAFQAGGVDYVTKPFQFEEVAARVETHLRLRLYQKKMTEYSRDLEELVISQVREISDAQMATIFAMVKLSESRDDDTGAHIWRVREYCRALATALADEPPLIGVIDRGFIENIYNASPLHDIGKVGISDLILLKPGKLTGEEFEIMKTHTRIGANTLEEVIRKHPSNEFIRMGVDIARYHHERWDGSGYPHGLAGSAIPLAARIMAVADIYDALRTARPYKPPFPHGKTVAIITQGDGRTMPAHFDPDVLRVFAATHELLEKIYEGFETTGE